MVEHLRSTVIFLKERKFQVRVRGIFGPPTPTIRASYKKYYSLWESDLAQKSRMMQQALDNSEDFLSQSGILLSHKSAYIDVGNKTRIKNYPRLHIVLDIAGQIYSQVNISKSSANIRP